MTLAKDKQLDWAQFPCQHCGALLNYAPGQSALSCEYCGTTNAIPERDLEIRELDYVRTLDELETLEKPVSSITVHCGECGAEYTLDKDIHADNCSFCGAAIVVDTEQHRQLQPQAVLPFQITNEQADQAFSTWLSRIWFAPSNLKKYARSDHRLAGMYLPYWTFDSDADAAYQGFRGTYYQVRERVSVVVNGRRQMQSRLVTKVRWTPTSGRISRKFDDVLVVATRSLPTRMLKKLRSWQLTSLKAYQAAYLSGFKSELYQTTPEQGFDEAHSIMEQQLRQDIKHDIGGDLQQITSMRTQHQDVSFKPVLLPIWMAAYQYRKKTYRFVVNGQTGEVQGERPYSIWKIASLVVLGIAGLLLILFLAENAQTVSGGYR